MSEGPGPAGPTRVTHVVISLDVGGLERIVLDLVRRGRDLGQDVAVVCLERPGTLASQVEAAGASVWCVHKPPGRRPETMGKLREVFARIRPDVIHSHQIGALIYAGPAAKRAGRPVVVHTEHINHAAKRTGVADRVKIRLLWGLAGRYAARFFCVSEDIVEAVAAFGVVPRRKLSVVRNGIDTAAFAPSDSSRAEAFEVFHTLGVPADSEIVGSVGRLAEVKRQDVLIRGFSMIARERPRAHLVLVGDGPERSRLQDLAQSLDMSNRVHFAGYQDRPERLVRGMDVFALTSRLEGLPLVILEAWAAGVAVVATPVGGVASLIRDGEDGHLVPVGDAEATGRAIGGLLADPERTRRIGRAGQIRATSEYDAAMMAAAYDRHYREALVGRRLAARA